MLEEGLIKLAMLERASAFVLASRVDEKLRFCVSHSKLNIVTVRKKDPWQRMEKCVESLGNATIFSTIDCNRGYWQIEIVEADRNNTTFSSHHGLSRFIRMAFRLNIALALLQRAVDIVLSGARLQFALVYHNDIIFYSKSVTEHSGHTHIVLTLL